MGTSIGVPSGSFLRMVIGRKPFSSSSFAMSMGWLTFSGVSIRMGAPKLIWRALAPMILALSNRVSIGGPVIDFSELISLNPHPKILFQSFAGWHVSNR